MNENMYTDALIEISRLNGQIARQERAIKTLISERDSAIGKIKNKNQADSDIIVLKKTDYFMLLLTALYNSKTEKEAEMMVNGYMENQTDKTKMEFLSYIDNYAEMIDESKAAGMNEN